MNNTDTSGATPAELNKGECEAILERNGVGRLACFSPVDRECYVVPVGYAYHRDTVYLGLAPGRKLTYLEQQPEGVCLEVEEVVGSGDWKTVLVMGDFSYVSTRDNSIYNPPRGLLRTVFDIGLSPYPHESVVLCKLDVRRITGRHDSWTPAASSLERSRQGS